MLAPHSAPQEILGKTGAACSCHLCLGPPQSYVLMVRSMFPKYVACTNRGRLLHCLWGGGLDREPWKIPATGYGKADHHYLKSRQMWKRRCVPWMAWKQGKLLQIQGHYSVCPVYTWVMNQCLVSLCKKGDTHTRNKVFFEQTWVFA